MEVPQIKALAILSRKQYIIKKFGEDIYREIIDRLDKEDKEIIADLTIVSQWHSEETGKNFLLAAEKILSQYGNLERIFYEMGRFIATDNVPRFYKSLVSLLNINFLLKISTKIYRMYHTHGEARAEQIDKNKTYLYIIDHPSPCKPFCWEMAGYIHGVAELAGLRVPVPVQEIECVLEGKKYCKYLGVWK